MTVDLDPSGRHARADRGEHRLAGALRRQGRGDAARRPRRSSRCCASCMRAPRRAHGERTEENAMAEAFICDAVRTPIGRYGGALAKVRTDDLAAVPIQALMERHPKVDWSRLDEVFFGCANQAGEDNRNVARMALLLAGLPDIDPRPAPSTGSAPRASTRSAPRRARSGPARSISPSPAASNSMTRAPFVMGKARRSVPAQRRDLRHHHRLALHQSADEAAIRRRFDAGDRRERRRGIPGRARRPGRLRAALAAARRQGAGRRASSPRRSCRSRCPAARPARPSSTRTSIRVRTRRSRAWPSSSRSCAIRGTRHRRQRLRRQRRRGGHDRSPRRRRSKEHGLTPFARIARHGVGRRAAAHHGHRPGAVDAQAHGAARAEDRRLRRDRAQRGLRLAGARLPAPARRSRTTPSTSTRTAARSRSAIRSACRARGSPSRRRISWSRPAARRARHHVRRRRPGRVARDRARVAGAFSGEVCSGSP